MKKLLKRSLILFPIFDNVQEIENIRRKYDSLYNLIRPHITLVFPFEHDISNSQLEGLIRQVIKYIKPFNLKMQHITLNNNKLYLNVKDGIDNIIKLHDNLYEILPFNYDMKYTYIPHITLGKINEDQKNMIVDQFSNFNESFTTTIDKLYVECIDEHDKSNIIMEISL